MLNPSYKNDLPKIADTLSKEGILLLKGVLSDPNSLLAKLVPLMGSLEKEFHPLTHKYLTKANSKELRAALKVLLTELSFLGEFEPQLYVFGEGDFSLLSDLVSGEEGVVGFLDLSSSWDYEWGGYLAIEQEPVTLEFNSLLLTKMAGNRWFVKKINHYAKGSKVLLVLREKI